MKYQYYFIVISIFFILQGCKKDLPTSATIITGKVVDENNMPVMGVVFDCYGIQYKGISPITTFDKSTYSDNNGIYNISVVVPNGTDQVFFQPQNSTVLQFGVNYDIYLQKDNTYTVFSGGLTRISNYGETNAYNFQIRKK